MAQSSNYATQLSTLLQADPLAGRLHTIPIMIFCAKQEELSIVRDTLKLQDDLATLEQTIIDSYKTTFHIGHFDVLSGHSGQRHDGCTEFYLVCGPRQGPESAAAAASHIMTLYRPKFALSIGICGGIPGKINITDVLFACSAVNYEAGKRNKITDDNKKDDEFEMDLHVLDVDSDIRNQVVDLIRKDDGNFWKEGCMITGSAVRKDIVTLIPQINRRVPRDYKGLDMEASAFFTACKVCQVGALPVIKGVSDMGDEGKNDDTHQLCIKRAVIASLKLLKAYFSHHPEYWKKNYKP